MRPIKIVFLTFAAVLLISVSSVARALVLREKVLDSSRYGWNSNAADAMDYSQQVADDLTLSFAGVGNRLSWFGVASLTSTSQSFRVRVFSDVSGMPTADAFYDELIGFVGGTSTGQTNDQRRPILRYSSPIPPLALAVNTTYWLTIASTDAPLWTWSHAHAGISGNDVFYRQGDVNAWLSTSALGFQDRLEQSFILEGVPEPSTILLASLPAVLAFRRSTVRRQPRL